MAAESVESEALSRTRFTLEQLAMTERQWPNILITGYVRYADPPRLLR